MIFRNCATGYLRQSRRIWNNLPTTIREGRLGRAYGKHLHHLVCRYGDRRQSHSTFFLRNRPELELMLQLLEHTSQNARINISVVACSKGAEVYSILWKIRSTRPDLTVIASAVDISQEVIDFAAVGTYSLKSIDATTTPDHEQTGQAIDMNWKDQLWGQQALSMFERMTAGEIYQMFEVTGDQAMVRPWLKQGITWLAGDATDPNFAAALGPQDIVVANRFLCHMEPATAEGCLRNIAHLVKPGGYIFVSGVDLDVRAKVARDLGWQPVTHLIKEVHEGDFSLITGWPLEYWGLEPFCQGPVDWRVRFASVFRITESENR
jgi:chemotaxis methyl-accepting protein methylase